MAAERDEDLAPQTESSTLEDEAVTFIGTDTRRDIQKDVEGNSPSTLMDELETLSAALFAAGRPVKAQELSSLLGISVSAIERLIAFLAVRLQAAGLGFVVEAVAGGYRLVVPSVIAARLEPLLALAPLPLLSAAALETLAIIAYRQPVTRAEVELLRGSGVSSTLDTLQERELIKVVGRKDVIGKPLLYGTTERFLLEFGLASLNDLPPLENEDFG